jgi:hypothetical protein
VKRFIEWDSLDVRVDGERLNELARETIAGDPLVERLQLQFSNGLLRIEGAIRKLISVPFAVEVTRIEPAGTSIHVPLQRMSAGPIPIPTLLLGLVRDRFPKDLFRYRDPATLVVSLDRFLPPFVSTEIRQVSIIDGGLAVTLGRGGADLPSGGSDGTEGPE